MTSQPTRRLVLLRHAKAASPHGVPDRERPLSGQGRRNARAAARWMAAHGFRPDLAITSDARRARQTWELVSAAWSKKPVALRSDPRLYHADLLDLLDVVHEAPDSARVLALVGHEPSMSATALLLAGRGSDPVATARLREKFPTNGIVFLHFTGRWGGLVAGSAALESFVVPRESDGSS